MGKRPRAPLGSSTSQFCYGHKTAARSVLSCCPPRSFDALHDFRAGATGEQRTSPALAFEIRKAYDRREWALELMSDLQLSPVEFGVKLALGEFAETAAGKIRAGLHVRTELQSKWRVDSEAFREWRALLERVGILTFQATKLELEEARGFSISLRPLPVVVVNIKDAYRGRIFTLLHEATHLALNDGGICDLDDNERRNASARIESYCNRVAGAILFPRDELLNTIEVRSHRTSEMTWSESSTRSGRNRRRRGLPRRTSFQCPAQALSSPPLSLKISIENTSRQATCRTISKSESNISPKSSATIVGRSWWVKEDSGLQHRFQRHSGSFSILSARCVSHNLDTDGRCRSGWNRLRHR